MLRQLPRLSPWRRTLSSSTESIPLSAQIRGLLHAVLAPSHTWSWASQESLRSRRPHGAVLLSLQMTEGRHCQVHLLDDRNLELLVQVQTPFFWAPVAGCQISLLIFFSSAIGG